MPLNCLPVFGAFESKKAISLVYHVRSSWLSWSAASAAGDLFWPLPPLPWPSMMALMASGSGESSGSYNGSIPGQIEERGVTADAFAAEKRELQRKMKSLEKQEDLHVLKKEEARTRKYMDRMRASFGQELYDMEKEANRLSSEMRQLQDKRDVQYKEMERKLAKLQESLNRLSYED